MILVTGAAGKTGQAVIQALVERETAVLALVHKETQIQTVQALGVKKIVVGDMGSQSTMEQALHGVKAIYHICPNVNPHELDIGKVIINAAQSTEVERFVYHSVFHPHIETMTHHWQKMRVEEQLFTSGLAYTILQPAPYMQNMLAYWDEIMENGRYSLPYSAQIGIGCIDLKDVAEAAVTVLCEPGHVGAIYELCGEANLSQKEMSQLLGQQLERTIQVDYISVTTWETIALKNGLGDYQVKSLSNMFRYYEQFGYSGNSRILACLLNRPPTSFADFVKRMIQEHLSE